MDTPFERGRDLFLQGLAHYQAARFAEAEAAFVASLAQVPGRASTLANLGATRLRLGKLADALEPLQRAVAQEPGDVDAWGHQAKVLAALGRHGEALACVDRTLALDASRGAAWGLRGMLLRDLGRPAEAAPAFERAIALGCEVELNRYFLASLRGQDAPPAPPPDYVEALFDSYAGEFDEHLVGALNYRAPQVLVDGLGARTGRVSRALDLGCGTGLCGPLLKTLADAVDGVDVSGQMLARAAALGVYAQLAQEELVAYLRGTPRRYGVVVAADVFIYVGALDPVFEAVARVQDAGGVFCFSVEAAPEDCDFKLQPSLRYAHSETGVRALAARHGYTVVDVLRRPVREEQRVPIAGAFFWLIRA